MSAMIKAARWAWFEWCEWRCRVVIGRLLEGRD